MSSKVLEHLSRDSSKSTRDLAAVLSAIEVLNPRIVEQLIMTRKVKINLTWQRVDTVVVPNITIEIDNPQKPHDSKPPTTYVEG